MSDVLSNALDGLCVSAVVFVQDYVQFQLDGPILSTYSLPSVTVEGRTIKSGDPGWRDALCSLIGVCVASVDASETLLTIRFAGNLRINVPLGAMTESGTLDSGAGLPNIVF